MSTDRQKRIEQTGEAILSQLGEGDKSIFNRDWWYGRIMDWSMKNPSFKTQMFRFVDVLPVLESGSEVARHLKEYFSQGDELPSIFNFGVGVGSLAPGLLAGAVRKNVTQMAKLFITGETLGEALSVLKKSRKQKRVCATIDLLGEATLSEKEALEYQTRYIDLVNGLSSEIWDPLPLLDEDEAGAIPQCNISVKMTALYSQIRHTAWKESCEKIKSRLRPIFSLARERNVFVNLDMEQYAHKNLTLEVFKDLALEEDLRDYRHLGIVIQAYLRDSYSDLESLANFAKARGTPLTVRLVKGAYWDFETIHADQMRWPIPVYTNKAESDANFERCAELIIRNYPHLKLAVGSHNVRSIAACIEIAKEYNLNPKAFEIQMLYGMGDSIKTALISEGYRVREYATIGDLIPGMAYLVRRLLENTSNESFLRSKFAEDVDSKTLLADPALKASPSDPAPPRRPGEFLNEPLLDFAQESHRKSLSRSLAAHREYSCLPLVIGGARLTTERTLESRNPSHPTQVLGSFHLAGKEDVERAVVAAEKAFEVWKNVPFDERAKALEKVAEGIRKKRFDFVALEVLEVGKNWMEADADVAEAIDFCMYYASEIRRLGPGHRVSYVSGESSRLVYEPRGVSVVIAPWNFPLAILCGMVTASLAAGNTVVMKPAEQSTLVAGEFMDILTSVGLPAGAVNFLPGLGEEVGSYLVQHPKVQLIAFTGSKEVGLKILSESAKPHGGQNHVKHCVIEMGGKNAIIVDSDADLDEAVQGVTASAFGFQGQKCSACSRVIILEGLYERFLERLVESVRSFPAGFAEDPGTFLGPVIDEESQGRILKAIELGKSQGKLIFQGQTPAEGYFVPPTLFANLDPESEIGQQEIFGPVLAVFKVRDLDEALMLADGTPFALTGGFYSRSPAHIEKVRKNFRVGNLYINRSCTGAIVGRHPFGGFKLSGLGTKAGGPDYLQQFMLARTITENTLRRGFAPTEESS